MCNVIIFVMLFLMAADVSAQCERPFVGENRILADESGLQTFPEGATVKFKCLSGYVSLETTAARWIVCNGSQWSELELRCKKKSCGNPGEIRNGRYLYEPTDGNLFGAVITAECDEGYQLLGPPTRSCRQNGWDTRAPVCEAVICRAPPGIQNGVLQPSKESYEYGDAIEFFCKRGFHLFGSQALSCSSDGTFQPAVPQCLMVSCDKPEIFNAHKTEGKSPPYTYKQVVRYECDEGYKMEGSGFLICTEKGWDPAPPRCDVITCTNPPNIANGLLNPQKEVYNYKEKVSYSCIKGFYLNKASSISCKLDGTFEPLFSQCIEIICPSPVILGGFVSKEKEVYKYDDTVQFSCYDGYKLEESNIRTCKEHGWSPSFPRCMEITCDEPNIPSAFIAKGKASSYKYKSSIQIQCYPGNKMEGSDLLSCGENGWNSPFPKCSPVTCLPPPGINNGRFQYLERVYQYRQTVTYFCDKGYKLKGASTISCTEQGRFQDPPQCLDLICDKPNIDNGFIVQEESPLYKYKASIHVQCNRFFSMTGSDHLTCGENGWDQPLPNCQSGYWIWILLGIILALLIGGVACVAWFWKNNKADENSITKRSNSVKSDHCTLVSMTSDSFQAKEMLETVPLKTMN